jgi:hypothetical protein
MDDVDVASIKDMPHKLLAIIDLEMDPINPKACDAIIDCSRISVNG